MVGGIRNRIIFGGLGGGAKNFVVDVSPCVPGTDFIFVLSFRYILFDYVIFSSEAP